MNLFRVAFIVRDIEREMKLIDECGVAGKSPYGREFNDREMGQFEGMHYAYSRVRHMLVGGGLDY